MSEDVQPDEDRSEASSASDAGPVFTSDDVVWNKPNRLVAWSPFAIVLACLGIVAAAVTKTVALSVPSVIALYAAMFGLAMRFGSNPWPTRRRGRLRADAGGVTLDGAPLVKRTDIKNGLVVPRPDDKPIVRLQVRRRPPVDLVVADREEGLALLRALGLDASQANARFDLPPNMLPARSIATLLVLAIGGAAACGALASLFHAPHLFGGFRFALIAIFGAYAILARPKLLVGADGVLLTVLGAKTFVGYRDIARVLLAQDKDTFRGYRYHTLVIEKTNGEVLRWKLGRVQWERSRTTAASIYERVQEGLVEFEKNRSGATAMALERGARSIDEWLRSLDAIGTGANADHRTAAVSEETLWRVVEDPAAEASARAGAAVALRRKVDGEGKKRLRAIAERSASPKIRIAIETAADDGKAEAAVAEALADLEAGDVREREKVRS